MARCRICGRAMLSSDRHWTGALICHRRRCRFERDSLGKYRIWEMEAGSPSKKDLGVAQ